MHQREDAEPVDPDVLAALRRTSACGFGLDEGFEKYCEALTELEIFTVFYARDEANVDYVPEKDAALVRGCLAGLREPQVTVRAAGAWCLGTRPLRITARQIDLMVARVAREESWAVRRYLAGALLEQKLSDAQCAEIARIVVAWKREPAAEAVVEMLVTRIARDVEAPSKEVIALAKALARGAEDRVRLDAFAILFEARTEAAPTCQLLNELIRERRGDWFDLAKPAVDAKADCALDLERVIDGLVSHTEEMARVGEPEVAKDLYFLRDTLAGSVPYSAAQRARLVGAAGRAQAKLSDATLRGIAKEVERLASKAP